MLPYSNVQDPDPTLQKKPGSDPLKKPRIRPFRRKNNDPTLQKKTRSDPLDKKKPDPTIFKNRKQSFFFKNRIRIRPNTGIHICKDPNPDLDKDSYPDPAESLIGKIIQNLFKETYFFSSAEKCYLNFGWYRTYFVAI